MGILLSEVDRIAKRLTNFSSLHSSINNDKELKELSEKRQDIKELFEISLKLEGLARHPSIHAAGVVIADKPLDNYVPLYSTNGIDTTQYPMEAIQSIGLLKVDLLGIVTLDIIDTAIELIEKNRHNKIDIQSLTLDDRKTYELLSSGGTKGVFQLESSGMQDILQKLKPSKFEDIIAVLALHRPGPLHSGMVDNYIKYRHHPEQITYLHPSLEGILKETYGIILYQEQVMRIANKLGNFTLAESDDLRKAMGKKIPEIISEYRDKFIQGATKNDIPKHIANQIFEIMEYFGGYGFNKSHSAAYAMTSYRTAYLKANYPVEFLASLLTYHSSDTDKLLEYIEECNRLKIKVAPPDINESQGEFTVDGDEIIYGLSAVKNVGVKAVKSIVQARAKQRHFTSIYDFCERLSLSEVDKLVIESLIKAGAFDSILKSRTGKKINRNQFLQGLEQIIYIVNQHQLDRRQGQLNIVSSSDKYTYPPLPDTPELSEEETLCYEKESLGFYVSGHPLVKYEKTIREITSLPINQLLARDEPIEEVKICGIISNLETVASKGKQREKTVYFKLRDLSGVINSVVYSEELKKCRHLLHNNKIVCIRGRMDFRKGEPIIKVKEMASIDNPEAMYNCAVIDISLTGLQNDIINGLKDVLLAHPGNCQVIIKAKTPANEIALIKLSNDYSVSISSRFREDITELLGQDALGFRID
jgi:DNA polymerase-3 subunit alpha